MSSESAFLSDQGLPLESHFILDHCPTKVHQTPEIVYLAFASLVGVVGDGEVEHAVLDVVLHVLVLRLEVHLRPYFELHLLDLAVSLPHHFLMLHLLGVLE